MRLWWLAALPVILLPACAPRKGPGARAGERPATAAVQPSKELTLSKQAPAAARATAPAIPLEQTLPALPFPSLLPEDFELGPLADRIGSGRDERQAAATADRFLTGLATGKVPADDLAPERREELTASLTYYLDQNLRPVWHRLGPLTMETGVAGEHSAWIKVRLRGEPGSCSGELYLSRLEGRWYISDVQIGLAFLGEPAARREEKFIPLGYSGRLD